MKAFFQRIWARVVLWYHTKVQSTLSSVLVGISGADFLTALTSYEHDLVTLLGAKLHAGIRLVAGAIILYRARQVAKGPSQ